MNGMDTLIINMLALRNYTLEAAHHMYYLPFHFTSRNIHQFHNTATSRGGFLFTNTSNLRTQWCASTLFTGPDGNTGDTTNITIPNLAKSWKRDEFVHTDGAKKQRHGARRRRNGSSPGEGCACNPVSTHFLLHAVGAGNPVAVPSLVR
jgi:hypothetical protein